MTVLQWLQFCKLSTGGASVAAPSVNNNLLQPPAGKEFSSGLQTAVILSLCAIFTSFSVISIISMKSPVIIHKSLVGSDLAKALGQKYKIRGECTWL